MAFDLIKIFIIASKQTEKMRLLINAILILLVAGLVLVLVGSIQEPINFKNEKQKRERAVIDKLMTIRNAQELYRSIKEEFAPDFETLKKVLETENFAIIKVIGDPDDPTFTGEITYDTSYAPAIDSVRALGINLDSLHYVPYGNGASFEMKADTITYQSTLVPVLEVGAKRKVFMGKYASSKYAKYDQNYDPEKPVKFGNMTAPNLSGNWER